VTGYEPIVVPPEWNKASDRDWTNALADLPLFEGVSRRELRRIVREAEFAEFGPGEAVVSTGGPSDFFYVILGGDARVAAKPAAQPLTTGDYFGEMGLLSGEPRSATVIATTDLHVMRLPRRAFDDVVERHPAVARRFLTGLGDRVRDLEHQAARRET
jgi:CRP-like cAMP-binding protein